MEATAAHSEVAFNRSFEFRRSEALLKCWRLNIQVCKCKQLVYSCSVTSARTLGSLVGILWVGWCSFWLTHFPFYSFSQNSIFLGPTRLPIKEVFKNNSSRGEGGEVRATEAWTWPITSPSSIICILPVSLQGQSWEMKLY